MSKALLSGGFVRRILVFVLLAVASGAPVVSAAVLPDQTWAGGLFDAADEDAVLLLVWDQSSPVAPSIVAVHQFAWAYLPVLPSAPLAPVHVRATADSRSPAPLRVTPSARHSRSAMSVRTRRRAATVVDQKGDGAVRRRRR